MIIFLAHLFLYSLRSFAFFFGSNFREKKKNTVFQNSQNLKFSIVVPARNEEKNIENCIVSLSELNFNDNEYEIIIVDDDSTDNTKNIIQGLSEEISNLRLISSDINYNSKHKNLKGKAGAIDTGIKSARTEIILMTDADCTFHPDWASSILSEFSEDGKAFVASFTLVAAHNIFAQIQNYEWIFMHTMARAGVGLGWPVGCFGNNIAIRKSVYQEIGGYENLPFSVTEDLSLQLAVASKFSAQQSSGLSYPCSVQMTVTTAPCPTFSEYLKQHHRWAIGGQRLGLRATIFVLVSAMAWASVFYNFWTANYNLAILTILLKVFGDFLVIFPSLIRLKLKKLWLWHLPSVLFFMIMELVIPILLLKKEVSWKGRKF